VELTGITALKMKILRLSWAERVAWMNENEEARKVMEQDAADLSEKSRRGGMRNRWVETILEYMDLESEYETKDWIKIIEEAQKLDK